MNYYMHLIQQCCFLNMLFIAVFYHNSSTDIHSFFNTEFKLFKKLPSIKSGCHLYLSYLHINMITVRPSS